MLQFPYFATLLSNNKWVYNTKMPFFLSEEYGCNLRARENVFSNAF